MTRCKWNKSREKSDRGQRIRQKKEWIEVIREGMKACEEMIRNRKRWRGKIQVVDSLLAWNKGKNRKEDVVGGSE